MDNPFIPLIIVFLFISSFTDFTKNVIFKRDMLKKLDAMEKRISELEKKSNE